MLDNRVALVTGGSGAIGTACCRILAQLGAQVAVGYRSDKEAATATAEECIGGFAVNIDVTEPASVASAYEQIEEQAGPVDILVNNAGITRDQVLLRMSEQDWSSVIETSLTGAFRCTKRALPSMIQHGWGRVVSIGSVVGTLGNRGQTNYAAAKAGLIGFTKALAKEVTAKGVTINVVAPGFIDTPMTAAISPSARERLTDLIPAGRIGDPAEVAEAVSFCLTNPYVTGQVIHIDGGMT